MQVRGLTADEEGRRGRRKEKRGGRGRKKTRRRGGGGKNRRQREKGGRKEQRLCVVEDRKQETQTYSLCSADSLPSCLPNAKRK